VCTLDRDAGLVLTADDVRPGTTDLEFVFDPAWRDGGTISGRVFDAATLEPLTGFAAALNRYWDGSTSRSGPNLLPVKGAPQPRFEPDGRFVFEHVTFGSRYVVELSAPGYATVRVGPVDPRQGETFLEAPLFRTSPLDVRVVLADGAAAPTASVTCLLPEDKPVATPFFRRLLRTVADADGLATFDELGPGVYHLQAFTADACSLPCVVVVPTANPGPVTLELAPNPSARSLVVTVRDRFGVPVEGAPVRAQCQRPGPMTKPGVTGFGEWSVQTGPAGDGRFDELPAGVYEITCIDPDLGLASPHVVVLSSMDVPSIELVLH
jgi:hypothetical protein